MLGWSISYALCYVLQCCSFSPLRCWGGLYHNMCRIRICKSFSPLRCWGGLYLMELVEELNGKVLVPFDVGVVYIHIYSPTSLSVCFSPLRCWGGLYHNGLRTKILSFSFSPLRCWGGLYPNGLTKAIKSWF